MFPGSNPAEVDVFCQDVRILSTSPPGGPLSHRIGVNIKLKSSLIKHNLPHFQ